MHFEITATMKLSVVVCVYNEEENIEPMLRRITESLPGVDYEMVFVDDGSTDGTLAALRSAKNARLKIIELRKNYGQSLALMAGIDHAQGDYIATLDGDLQNDPADIPGMLALLEKGNWDVVAGERANRQDGMFLRKIPSKIANWIIRSTSGVRMKDYGCSLRVFKSEIAKGLGLYGELHRFIPVLLHLDGAKMTQVEVRHHPRQFGVSKYGLSRTFKVVSDLLLMLFFKKYMQRPMHLFATWGVGIFIVGVLINLYLVGLKIAGHDIWGRPLLILGLMLVIGGIQLITIGIILEMLMRTYYESQDKRPYQIRSIY